MFCSSSDEVESSSQLPSENIEKRITPSISPLTVQSLVSLVCPKVQTEKFLTIVHWENV